jgi:pyruvate/2-oxoglutarate dehydrogenase complex dihydrolipoamide acyltransferase (E2) component
MSDIAQALAKAKERTGHTTAPFLASGVGPSPAGARPTASEIALRKARARQRFWVTLVIIALPLTGFVLWMRLGDEDAASKAAAGPVPAGAESVVASHPPATAEPARPAPSGPPAVNPAATPDVRLIAAVNELSISAVIPGNPTRIMLSGRVVRAGDVAEGELVFVGIADGMLQFSDSRGALYTRRY